MATMTTRQADKAIKSGNPVMVVGFAGIVFRFTIVARDRTTVRGAYLWTDGEVYEGVFSRRDLTLVEGV